ncbi:MAG TPA: hypothetical protein VK753_01960, partial [Xanthomonadaceae bacterium]|nr:hypothetical protein [Xanthomonadaceae bacterium]
QQRATDVQTLIERADNRSSVVFGAGIGIALSMLVPITAAIPPLLLASAICWSTHHWEWFSQLFSILFILYFAPLLLAMQIDRRFGARFAPEGRVARILDEVLGFYRRIGLGQSTNTPLMQFLSHYGRRGALILLATIISAALIVILQDGATPDWQLGGYGMLPDDAPGYPNLVLDDHYASRRKDTSRLVPFISDLVAGDAYLQLFIPYDPRNDPRAIEKQCPGLSTSPQPATTASYSTQLLDCLARIHPLTLDGKPLALRYDFSSDPRSGVRGLLGMIDARALTPGRHELAVLQPADPDQDQAATLWHIPFWR